MTVRIGISGWRYPPWRGVFYPDDLAQRRELEYAARRFASIELNGSFYSLQTPKSYSAWHDATPGDFVFAVKAPRFLTHMLRLRDIDKPLANFLASGVLRLRAKLGPLLWQLPPTFRFDETRLDHFLSQLPRDTEQALALARRRDVERMRGRSALAIDCRRPLRHALEVRHESFCDPRFIALLRRHKVALVVADTAHHDIVLLAPDGETVLRRYGGGERGRRDGPQPLFAERLQWPTKTGVDTRLVAGAAIFGIGWGLSGFCPGPAI
ncbi:MAG: DUF72 domain-containing protein, partial [Proteobacteria bacterium]|nr:DUF72 domain-containing protein [Pseudomonadota bacterium]